METQMKKLITVLLCGALLLVPIETSRAPIGLPGVIIIMTCIVATATLVVYLYAHNPTNPTGRRLVAVVLEYSNDNITWNPAVTNIIPENSGPTPAFAAYMQDHDHEYYRSRIIPMPTNNIQLVPGSRFQPVLNEWSLASARLAQQMP